MTRYDLSDHRPLQSAQSHFPSSVVDFRLKPYLWCGDNPLSPAQPLALRAPV
ncbi:Uncharacterised protein [Vibrio cholerae]|nr:Uncharacterised protein [Vibrio cholerae]